MWCEITSNDCFVTFFPRKGRKIKLREFQIDQKSLQNKSGNPKYFKR